MPRRAALASLVVAGAFLLGACGGGEATRGSAKDAVRDRLRERSEEAGGPITGGEADEIAECVSNGLFDPDRFTADERNDATSAPDGDRPSAELAARVDALVDECIRGGGAASSDDGADGGDGDSGDGDADEDGDEG